MTVHLNLAAGETMLVAPSSPGSPVLQVQLLIDPTHHAPPAHIHPRSAESFTVVEGALRVRLGRRRWVMTEGESVTVPPGAAHGYEGVPGVKTTVAIEIAPPGAMAEFFAALYGLPPEDRDARTGQPTLRAVAALLVKHEEDLIPAIPRVVAWPLLRVVAALPGGRAARPRP